MFYATSTGGNITVARMDMQGFDFAGPEQTLTLPDGLTATNITPISHRATPQAIRTGSIFPPTAPSAR